MLFVTDASFFSMVQQETAEFPNLCQTLKITLLLTSRPSSEGMQPLNLWRNSSIGPIDKSSEQQGNILLASIGK
jgi:hypothetical protein